MEKKKATPTQRAAVRETLLKRHPNEKCTDRDDKTKTFASALKKSTINTYREQCELRAVMQGKTPTVGGMVAAMDNASITSIQQKWTYRGSGQTSCPERRRLQHLRTFSHPLSWSLPCGTTTAGSR